MVGAVGGFMAGSIVAKLMLDRTGFHMEMQRALSETQKFGAKMAKIGSTLTKAVTLPLAAIGAASVKLAMDAVESENLFEVSMGGMADAARDWSKEMSKTLGLNQYETRKTIGIFDVMLKSMGLGEQAAFDMAKGLTQLSVDMASFYDLRPDEAFQKLQAGISGEIEPLKRLGIIISETTVKQWALNNGLIEQGQELTDSQKVLARYNLIMEKTKLAQGDWARTMETSAAVKIKILKNRTQELAVTVGMELLPVFQKILTAVQGAVKWFQGLSEHTKTLIVNVGLVTAAIGPFASVLGQFLVVLPRITASLRAMELSLGRVTLAFAAAAAAYAAAEWLRKNVFKDHSGQVDEITRKWDILINKVGGGWSSVAEKVIRQQAGVLGDFKYTIEDLTAVWNKYGQNSRRAFEAIISGGEGEELKNLFASIYREELRLAGIMESVAVNAMQQRSALDNLGGGVRTITQLTEEALPPAREFSAELGLWTTRIVEGVLPAARQLPAAMEDWLFGPLKTGMEATSQAFAGLYNDIAVGMSNLIEGLMSGTQAFTEFWSGAWKTIRGIFARALAEMLASELLTVAKEIIAAKAAAIAKVIKSVMSMPFPLNIALVGGAIAAVSALFAKHTKFAEGGAFEKPTVLQNAIVGEAGPEYLLPEKKLMGIVRGALAMPAPALAAAGGPAGNVAYLNFHAPIIQTTGLSRRDVDQASELIFGAMDKELRRRGYKTRFK